MRRFYVYILASRMRGTLYIGVTNSLSRRITEHKAGKGGSFSKRYGTHRLVYVETFESVSVAIQREKTLKRWPRTWKIRTIEKDNPGWRDLYDKIL
jgi:putative endonuclease